MVKKVNKQVLQIGTAIIWAGMLIGTSLFTQSEENNLDWQLIWIIVGGFILQNALLNAYLNNKKS